jgi:hypothetical protein
MKSMLTAQSDYDFLTKPIRRVNLRLPKLIATIAMLDYLSKSLVLRQRIFFRLQGERINATHKRLQCSTALVQSVLMQLFGASNTFIAL